MASSCTKRSAATARAHGSSVRTPFRRSWPRRTVAAEDRRFWSHHGDRSDRRAAGDEAERRRRARLSRGARRSRSRRPSCCCCGGRPIGAAAGEPSCHEAVIALRLEHRLSKREILALYLNLASYGNQTTGFARASRLYFGVGPEMLTPAQAAFLAGLPQRPSTFNPYRSQALAMSRQRVVLARMASGRRCSTPARLEEAQGRAADVLAPGPAVPRAALRRDGPGRRRHAASGPHRDHAGRAAAGGHRRYPADAPAGARPSWRGQRRGRRARQRAQRMAGLGGLRRLLRRRARRHDQRSADAAAARLGAQAVHLRAGASRRGSLPPASCPTCR